MIWTTSNDIEDDVNPEIDTIETTSNKTKRLKLESASAFRFMKNPDQRKGCEQALGAYKQGNIQPKSFVHGQLDLADESLFEPPRYELG